jgi:hypothetical protein
MLTDQHVRFTFARSHFPDRQKREYCVVSFLNKTPRDYSIVHADDLAEARRVANDICAGEAQAEIYRFDGTNLWLLVA